MVDLHTLDPTTLQAGPEADALVAEWRGWKLVSSGNKWSAIQEYWVAPDGSRVAKNQWSPSTNPAHAGEARREADRCWVQSDALRYSVWLGGCWAHCWLEEVNGDKCLAEALATTRAIAEVMKAKAIEKGEDDECHNG